MANSAQLSPADKVRPGDHGQWVARRVKGLFDQQPSAAQAKPVPSNAVPGNTPTDDAVASWIAAAPADNAVASWIAEAPADIADPDWDSFDSDVDDRDDDDAQPNANLLAAAARQQQAVAKPKKKPAKSRRSFFEITAYWTPRLVRLSWALAVCLALLVMLVVVILYAMGLIFGLGLFFEDGAASFLRGFMGASLWLVITLISTWLALYLYRLSCEFLIVVFDIAETLADIRDELRN